MAKEKNTDRNTDRVTAKKTSRVRKLAYKDKKKSVKVNEPIPSSFKILVKSFNHVWRNRRLFIGIMLIYTFLYLLLVRGLATNFQLPDTKQAIDNAGIDADSLTLGVTLLGTMFGSVGTTSSESAAVYQVFLFIFISLVLVWTLRQTYNSSSRVGVKQSLYSSMSPLVQYIIVWLAICLQLLPALIGISIYSIVSANGIAVGFLENAMWLVFMSVFVMISIFMFSSSLFATYIVSLPGMTPLAALRKAKLLVKFRRFAIIRKAVFIPFLILILSMLVFFPLVIYLPILAEVLFLIYTILLILFGHSYFYNLYKSLI